MSRISKHLQTPIPSEEPKLAVPGAGLPAMELFLSRAAFGMARNFASKRDLLDRFRREASLIKDLISGIPEKDRIRRVLIPRIFGIEDSSRNWSLYMTLRHLVIVDSAVIGILLRLSHGKTIPAKFRLRM